MKSIKIEPDHWFRLSKEASWIILGQALVVVGALVGVRVLTGLLDPAQYGDLALAMTMAMLVNQVIAGPLAAGFTRFYAPALEKSDLSDYLRACRDLMIAATGAIFILPFFIAAGLLVSGRAQWMSLAAATFAFALISGYSTAISGIQTAARQRPVVALHDGALVWLRFLLAAGFVAHFAATGTVAMIGNAIAGLIVLASQFIFLRKLFALSLTETGGAGAWARQIWDYTWPFAAWGVFTWAQSASDRWALETFRSAREVGLYAVLFQLGYSPISLLIGMASQFIAPIFFQHAGDGTDPARNASVKALALRMLQLALLLAALAFVVALMLHAHIFKLFSRNDYAEVSYLLPWVILAGGLFAAGQILALKTLSELRGHILAAVKISTALIGVAANILGARYAGVSGVVFAGLLFSAAYLFSLMPFAMGSPRYLPE